jgi:hypothetical protein
MNNIGMVVVAIIIGCSIIAAAVILSRTTVGRYQVVSVGGQAVVRIDAVTGTPWACGASGATFGCLEARELGPSRPAP